MENNQDRLIKVVDENGEEQEYEILFTFEENEHFNKNYVLVYEAGTGDQDQVDIHAFSYDENDTGTGGQLLAIESDEEWDMIEEVLNTYEHDVLGSEE